jgi:crotonobetainyl-CoA:carnitine CoA-transferase CaiB-like acyl-CoA transferase
MTQPERDPTAKAGAPPLAGIRVVELCTQIAGAYCGRQFALWGADVLMPESQDTPSPLRRLAPIVPSTGDSLTWQYIAAGKRTATLESLAPTTEALTALLSRAHVLITDARGECLEPWGIDLETLHARLPHLVIASVSPFGHDGPYARLHSSELIVQALSGYASLNGSSDGPPLKAPAHILAYAAGVAAFVAAAAGLFDALATGTGHLIESAELDSITAILPLLRSEYTGVHSKREGGPGTGVRAFPCCDGFVTFMPPTVRQRADYGAVLDIHDDVWPESVPGASREQRRDQLIAFLAERTKPKTRDHVFYGLLKRGIVCGKVAAPEDLIGDAHLEARGFFDAMIHPRLGRLRVAGAPARMTRTPPAPPAPAPDAAAPLDLDALGWTPVSAHHRTASRPGRPRRRPLEGVRLLDLTQAWIGPFAAMLLADLGADTIKIEAHRRPDVWRQWSANPVPLANVSADEVNASPNYNSVNRNKRSLCLDLKADAGRELFLRLVAQSDLLMENYTPRVMGRFGLDYETLAAVNPALVMTSFSGYGKTGPLADFKANGTSIEAMAGWDHFHRYPDGEPMVMGFYQADAISGLQMAAATLVALVHQRRTGDGQAIDGSMYEAAAGYIGEALLEAHFGLQQTCIGNGDPDHVLSGIYPCRGEDQWIAITIRDDAQLQQLRIIAGPHAPQFQEGRADTWIANWTATEDAGDLMSELQRAGIPAAVVRSTEAIFECEHLAARTWFRTIEHPDLGRHRYNGHPWRFANVLVPPDLPPPRLGEDSRALLTERLGLSTTEIDRLEAEDVTGSVIAKQSSSGTRTD